MSLVLSLLLLVGPVDTVATPIFPIDEVVVTAERVAREVRDVAASVSVLTGEEIRRSGARTVTDALATLPGVFVQRTSQFGRTDLDIRGVGDRGCRIAVLVDGRPEKMPIYGCVVTHTLPLNNVERIELVRGPLSVLYGSDAMGGVVNIITRRAYSPLDISGRVEYGSFNTIHSRLAAGTQQGDLNVLFSLDKAKSDGHLPNSQYNGNDLSLRAGYELSPAVSFDFTGKYFTGVKHEPKRTNDPDTLIATGWNQYDRGGLDLTANFRTQTANGFAKIYRTFGEHEFDPKDGWHSTDYTNGAILHAHRELRFGNLVQAGAEYKRLSGTRIISDTNKPSWARNQWDVFIQDEQTLGFLSANAGIRYSQDQISGGAVCPRLGLVAKTGFGLTGRASVNRGFRFAPLNYTSVFPPKNPDLRPEIAWNYEVGANLTLAELLSADLAGFMLKGQDLIELGPNPNPPPPVQFQNKGGFIFKGVEATLDGRYQFLRSRLGISFLDPGVNTRARPGLKISAEAGANLSRFDFTLGFQHVSRYYAQDSSRSPIPAYGTFDLRAGWQAFSWLRVFAAAENLLDAQYDTFCDLPGAAAGLYRMPGRSFTVGLDLRKP
ncbi:MAG: TonB-dependent receptor [candidate division WOR-3 bacterium]